MYRSESQHNKTLYAIAGVVVLCIIIAAIVVVKNYSPAKVIHGTSNFPQLDIVSGEISPSDSQTIINHIVALSGKDVPAKNIVVRPGSYQKTFSSGTDYIINFTADVSSIKSSYNLAVTHAQDVAANQIAITCAKVPLAGYHCLNTLDSVDYL